MYSVKTTLLILLFLVSRIVSCVSAGQRVPNSVTARCSRQLINEKVRKTFLLYVSSRFFFSKIPRIILDSSYPIFGDSENTGCCGFLMFPSFVDGFNVEDIILLVPVVVSKWFHCKRSVVDSGAFFWFWQPWPLTLNFCFVPLLLLILLYDLILTTTSRSAQFTSHFVCEGHFDLGCSHITV